MMMKYPDEFLESISNLIKTKGILHVVFNEFYNNPKSGEVYNIEDIILDIYQNIK